MKPKNFDMRHLSFLLTRRERRGIAVLSAVMVVSLAFGFNVHHILAPDRETLVVAEASIDIEDPFDHKSTRDTIDKDNNTPKEPKQDSPSSSSDSWHMPSATYDGPPLDPHTADSTELAAIGMPAYVIRNWLNYRSKGGRLYKKEDLNKIYGMDDNIYKNIVHHIKIPQKDNDSSFYKPITKPTLPEGISLDINTASEAEWEFLPGIGPGYASRIVKYREQLGGFMSVDQVGETWGLPDSTFLLIKPALELKTPHRKIAINTCAIEALAQHPYIDWKRAKLIIRYREQHGDYYDKADILRIQIFTEEWVDQWIDYVSFEPSMDSDDL